MTSLSMSSRSSVDRAPPPPRLFRHAEPISVLAETALETEGLNSHPGLGFCFGYQCLKFSVPAEAYLLCKDVESSGLLSGV